MATATNTSKPQAKITLHWLEVSRSHRILWLLEECGIPYELKTYKRGKDKLADPKLREVHPLGKSPIVEVEVPGSEKPIVLAESAVIVEYLCDYYGQHLVPARYQAGKEGQIGGESESWMRYRYFMHYAEGSIMPLVLIAIIMSNIKNAPVPFFLKPITGGIAGRVTSLFLKPNFDTHLKFLEDQLATAPNGGGYLCGDKLTAADVLNEFAFMGAQEVSGLKKEQFPKLWAYVDRCHQSESYKRAVKKIEEVEGKFEMKL